MAQKTSRTYISDRFVLELDGQYVGTLQSIEGGTLKSAGVVEEKIGKESLVTRYPGRPQYDDITIQVGMTMAPRFWEWLSKSFNYEAEKKDGAIVALDYDNHERWRRDFYGALIAEVGFPALDGAAKEPAYLTVKIAVEKIDVKKSSGKHAGEQDPKNEWEKQRLWLPSNFSFKVDKFGAGKKLPNAKVEAFTVKQNVITVPVGKELIAKKEPGRVEFPQLSVTVMERDADQWLKWYQEFVRDGEHTPGNESNGHIEYLKRDTNAQLLVLDIYSMGILEVSPVKHDSKQAQIQKLKISLYCERMELKPGAGTA
jgi:phage tail-like protein